MLEETKSIKDAFKQESVQEMSKKFYGVIRDILTLSNNQEDLRENFENIHGRSPQLKSLTVKYSVPSHSLVIKAIKLYSP